MTTENTTTTTTTTTGDKPWFDGKLDAEGVGYLTNRGWHDKPVADVALAAVQAHREATKLIGVPQEQLIRMPKDANDKAGWDNVYERLGRPKDAAGYDFKDLKDGAGKEVSKAFLDTVRQAAFERGLTQTQAVELAKSIVKYNDGQATESATVHQDTITKQQEALKQNWGKDFDAKMVVAKNGAEALGFDAETVTALEKVVGYDKVMNAMLKAGIKMGSAEILRDPNAPGGDKLMTKEQAMARKTELQNDPQWRQRYLEGGAAEAREMSALVRVIAG